MLNKITLRLDCIRVRLKIFRIIILNCLAEPHYSLIAEKSVIIKGTDSVV